MRLSAACLIAALVASAPPVRGQTADRTDLDRLAGQPVVAVRVLSSGTEIRDAQVASLIDIHPGQPLAMAAVRRTIVHLMGLGTYLDVQVRGRAVPGGVHVDIEMIPLRELGRLVFRGETALPQKVLRDSVTARFGTTLPLGRSTDIAQTLEQTYRDHGYLRASVRPRPLDDPSAVPGDLVFDVTPGRRATVRSLSYRGAPDPAVSDVRNRLGLQAGHPYEPAALRRKLGQAVDDFRSAGFLEARADAFPRIDEAGEGVDLTIAVTRGPVVTVRFAGDPLPPRELATLVPVAREGSADQDLLEDSERRIEDYLRAQGYRDARAPFTRAEADGRLAIVFTVDRGPLFRVAAVELTGLAAFNAADLTPLLKVKVGDPFVSARLDADAAAIAEAYRRRGYADVAIRSSVARAPATADSAGSVPAVVTLAVTEGVRTIVRGVRFVGTNLADEEIRSLVRIREGDPFYPPAMAADRDRLVTDYRNRGHRLVNVDSDVVVSPSGTDADVIFTIQEGPQILVDHILVVGNTRTSEATIRRELALRSGDALGDAAVAESQMRLSALGLFRRVTISELQHGDTHLRDVLITVEEAPATSVGYGGGIEFQKVETSEIAPRGFFEVGRRNLWGKNRAVNLFGRLSLRRRGTVDDADTSAAASTTDTGLEYRVVGSYREPRFLATHGDLQVAAVFEQGSRTSFRFRHRSARVDFADRAGEHWRYIGQFAVSRNEIFDERINAVDRPLIDRLFPQVRLSSVSGTAARDTRDDPFAPGAGSLVSLNGELALRQIGSEIGYAKTFLQGFAYRRVPAHPRFVLAGGVRLGLGTGVPRTVVLTGPDGRPLTGPDGTPQLIDVRDVPLSERFFAGGDTTVRGFQLDRLGRPDTFDRDGTPIGGHAEFIVNQEVRIGLWRDLGVVAFLDAGNVFAAVDDFSLRRLRGGIGAGFRYKSPVGPIRLDFGFKLGTLQTLGTRREDRFALHISIGQAF